jgi:uncharacterized protein
VSEPATDRSEAPPTKVAASRLVRAGLLFAGCLCVAVGGIGVVVPGLPSTGFFVLAAACFARSSPRFEAWVLRLPAIGPLVRDYRNGLGMPRLAKRAAVASIVVASGLSAGLAIGSWWIRAAVLALAAVGVWFVGTRIPTREDVLARIAPTSG